MAWQVVCALPELHLAANPFGDAGATGLARHIGALDRLQGLHLLRLRYQHFKSWYEGALPLELCCPPRSQSGILSFVTYRAMRPSCNSSSCRSIKIRPCVSGTCLR